MNKENCLQINKTALTQNELQLLEHMVMLIDHEGYIVVDESEIKDKTPTKIAVRDELKADFKIKLAIIRGKLRTMRKQAKY